MTQRALRRAMARRRRRRGGAFLVLALALLLLGAAYVYAQRVATPGPATPAGAEGTLRVHYLQVGQGDAVVWELPDGAIAVYDCGPPVREGEENPLVRYLRDTLGKPAGTRLAVFVASHGHLDHIGGCEELFEAYDFEHLYEAWYEGADAPESYRRYQRDVDGETPMLHTLPEIRPGAALALPSARATLLWPRAFAPGGWDEVAEASLVVRLEHGGTSFCFQGDIEDEQEAQLDATCDVYLVGHHGSRTASSAAWLARMRPQVAVVSYGENPYGHPHPETLCRLADAGVPVYGTNVAGPVVIETDGTAWKVVRGGREAVPGGC